jgi:hypothetical protein
MPPSRQKAHLLRHNRPDRPALQPLDIQRREDDDPFVSRSKAIRSQATLRRSPASSDELQRHVPVRPQTSIACRRVTATFAEPVSSDELHCDVFTRNLPEPASSDELHREISIHHQPFIARQRATANFVDPVSSDELHHDVSTRAQAPVTRPHAEADFSDLEFSAQLQGAFQSQPDAVQTTPHTARRSEVRSQREIHASPQRRRRVPEDNSPNDEYGPGVEDFFADIDELGADIETLNLDYYSDTFVGTALQPRELFNIAREPHRSNVEYRHRLLRADRECRKCGAKHWIEERVQPSSKADPKFRCCGEGHVIIPAPGLYPAGLQRLLSETEVRRGKVKRTARAQRFYTLIRHYNNAFAFCSLGVTFDRQLAQATAGSYNFRAHGSIYHRIAPLQAETRPPCFAQIWIFDTAEERVNLRQRAFENLDVAIVRLIGNTLAPINPFVQSLHINRRRLRTEPNIQLELSIVERQENDTRTFNRPTASEVAALVPASLRAAGKTRNVTSRASTSLFAIPCCVPLARPGGAIHIQPGISA